VIWHVITGEYPPQSGGVSAYTRDVARALAAAGDSVSVWAPPLQHGSDAPDASVHIHRLPDRFGAASLRQLSETIDRAAAGDRILVQYVPHAFGWKGANVPFCRWLARPRAAQLWVMFHEVSYPFDLRQNLAHNGLAVVNRLMARMISRAATRQFASIPAWRPMLQRISGRDVDVDWLPVPSGIPVATNAAASAALRGRVGAGRPIVGHFGTYGRTIRRMLADTLDVVLAKSDCAVLLIGRDSEEARRAIVARRPAAEARIVATGETTTEDISIAISAFDVLVQPYPDGVSTRRTTAMAGLAHGVPVATTAGWLTETLWHDVNATTLAPSDDAAALAHDVVRLLQSPDVRHELAERGRQLYESRFALRHTIRALRGATPRVHPAVA